MEQNSTDMPLLTAEQLDHLDYEEDTEVLS